MLTDTQRPGAEGGREREIKSRERSGTNGQRESEMLRETETEQ